MGTPDVEKDNKPVALWRFRDYDLLVGIDYESEKPLGLSTESARTEPPQNGSRFFDPTNRNL